MTRRRSLLPLVLSDEFRIYHLLGIWRSIRRDRACVRLFYRFAEFNRWPFQRGWHAILDSSLKRDCWIIINDLLLILLLKVHLLLSALSRWVKPIDVIVVSLMKKAFHGPRSVIVRSSHCVAWLSVDALNYLVMISVWRYEFLNVSLLLDQLSVVKRLRSISNIYTIRLFPASSLWPSSIVLAVKSQSLVWLFLSTRRPLPLLKLVPNFHLFKFVSLSLLNSLMDIYVWPILILKIAFKMYFLLRTFFNVIDRSTE